MAAGEAGLHPGRAVGGQVLDLHQVLLCEVAHVNKSRWDWPGTVPAWYVRGMGERTKYTPGTFSWTDLNTTDQEAAKTFYAELFGWSHFDMPVGEGVVLLDGEIDGKWVAAISPQPETAARCRRAAGLELVRHGR